MSSRVLAPVDAASVLPVCRRSSNLRNLVEQAISGTDHAVVAADRDDVRAILAEPDPATKLALSARAVRTMRQRMAPLFLALRDAAPTDHEARAVWHDIDERRWRMQTALDWLQHDNLSVAELAARLGGESEAAFSRAFKRPVGISPGAARRALPDTLREYSVSAMS